MRAARLGLDPLSRPTALLGEDDEDLERHQRLNFEDYGVEDYGRSFQATQQRLETDPHVQVEPVLDRLEPNIGNWMADPAFLEDMERVAGPFDPLPEDQGVSRYVRVCQALDQLLKDHFEM